MWQYNYSPELYHYGVLGMKWGVRRYQNKDGSLTKAGKKKYGTLTPIRYDESEDYAKLPNGKYWTSKSEKAYRKSLSYKDRKAWDKKQKQERKQSKRLERQAINRGEWYLSTEFFGKTKSKIRAKKFNKMVEYASKMSEQGVETHSDIGKKVVENTFRKK